MILEKLSFFQIQSIYHHQIYLALSRGAKIGILHGAASYVCQNSEGQINDTESISAGLDYPGVSPIHCFLKDTKRARYTYATDEEALNAHVMVTKYENLNPSSGIKPMK